MKKTILLIAMATLCLFLRVSAQALNPKTVPQPVQIGQMVPELTLTGVHHYKSNTLNLADLGARLIIIDFWATWCSPCVAMLPKLHQLQQKYQGDVQFISVSYQKEAEVLPFMKKLEERDKTEYRLPLITNDHTLRKLFPHTTLPHYVWIGANGVVKAITGMEDVTEVNIDQMLDNQMVSLREKKEITIPYDSGKPFLIDRNGGDGKEMIYHSVLSGYVEGLPGRCQVERADSVHINRIACVNVTKLMLYKYAFGGGYNTYFSDNRVSLEVDHPDEWTNELSGMAYRDWLSKPGHGLCYELQLPKQLTSGFFQVMQYNLKILFPQYTAAIEKRNIKTMVLVRNKGADLLKTTHPNGKQVNDFGLFGFTLQNSTINSFVNSIQNFYQQNSNIPFRNKTGYTDRVDMKITANLSSVPDMNRALKPYHLQWKEKWVKQNILVIRDAKKHSPTN